MAPTRTNAMKSSDLNSLNSHSENTKIIARSTPNASPQRRVATISLAQKQALIDNLQLEVTERARRLRADYARQARTLRERLDARLIRLPRGLRVMNMAQLLDQISNQQNPSKPSGKIKMAPPPKPIQISKASGTVASAATRTRGIKRPSTEMSNLSSDKENAQLDLEIPKKRVKTANSPAQSITSTSSGRPTRNASRKVNPAQILSPKSSNPQNISRSPAKASAAPNLPPPRPTSPLKLPGLVPAGRSTPAPAEKRKAIRGGRVASKAQTATVFNGRVQRAAQKINAAEKSQRAREKSDGSSVSDASAGTTIVTKKPAATKKPPTTKATNTSSLRGRILVSTKKDVPSVSAGGGRSLRSRK